MPVTLPIQSIENEINHLQVQLQPADPRMIAVLLVKTLTLWPLPAEWDEIAGFYLEALEDVPTDLVQLALKTIRLQYRYQQAPKPADIRATIVSPLVARRLALSRLQAMLQRARRDQLSAKTSNRQPQGDQSA